MPTISTTLKALLERVGELKTAQAEQPDDHLGEELALESPNDTLVRLLKRINEVEETQKGHQLHKSKQDINKKLQQFNMLQNKEQLKLSERMLTGLLEYVSNNGLLASEYHGDDASWVPSPGQKQCLEVVHESVPRIQLQLEYTAISIVSLSWS